MSSNLSRWPEFVNLSQFATMSTILSTICPIETRRITNSAFSSVLRRLDGAGLGGYVPAVCIIARRIVACYLAGTEPAAGLRSLVQSGEIPEREAAEILADRILEAASEADKLTLERKRARRLVGAEIDTTGDLWDRSAAENPLFAVPSPYRTNHAATSSKEARTHTQSRQSAHRMR